MDKLFVSCNESEKEVYAKVKGKIPSWVSGSMLRIGPAKWDLEDDFTLNHWLDGCALLCRFTFENGEVSFRSKYLESEAYNKMATVKRPVYTEFGTRAYPDPCKNVFARFFSQIVPSDLTDNGCVGIYRLKDEYYASSETCNLWRVDQNSLEAKEKINLDKLVGVNLASAHVQHIDSEKFAYNLTSSFMTGMKYHIIKIPLERSEEQKENKDVSLYKNASILVTIPSSWKTCITYYHSYAITQNYIVFLEQPLLVNGFKLMTCTPKGKPLKDCFEWHPNEKTKFFVVEKSSGKVVMKYYSESIFHFHHINAYEDDNHIVSDIITYDDSSILEKWSLDKMRNSEWDTNSPPIPRRYVIPLPTDQKFEKETNLVTLNYTEAKAYLNEKENIWLIPEQLGIPGFEIPTINYKYFNGKKYRYCYGSGVFERGHFANSICKLDLKTKEALIWRESETLYPGECVYIPKPGSTDEDDGVIVSIVLDSDESKPHFLLILDAKSFKEIARAEIYRNDGQIPATIHGVFTPNS